MHMSERFFRSNRPGYPHPVSSELEISGIRVAVGDCSVTERREWRPPYQTGKNCTCARKTPQTQRTGIHTLIYQVQETFNRTDYLSKDRLSVVLQIYRSVKWQTEAVRTECLLEKLYKLWFLHSGAVQKMFILWHSFLMSKLWSLQGCKILENLSCLLLKFFISR